MYTHAYKYRLRYKHKQEYFRNSSSYRYFNFILSAGVLSYPFYIFVSFLSIARSLSSNYVSTFTHSLNPVNLKLFQESGMVHTSVTLALGRWTPEDGKFEAAWTT
jgi:hypothetical protein